MRYAQEQLRKQQLQRQQQPTVESASSTASISSATLSSERPWLVHPVMRYGPPALYFLSIFVSLPLEFTEGNARWSIISNAAFVFSGSVLVGLSSFLTYRLRRKVLDHLLPLLAHSTMRSIPASYIPHLHLVLRRLTVLVVVGNTSMVASIVRAAMALEYDVQNPNQPLVAPNDMQPFQFQYSWVGGG
jgi:hypothetical protein